MNGGIPSKERSLLLDAPNLGELEKEYLCRCVDENYVSTVGPFVGEFEERFAAYVGCARAVSVQSGTAALHVALMVSGVGPGDEVICPALTFVATANPILYVGAVPVFVDVDPETWTLDPRGVERAITPRTKAVLPVHLYGVPCAMDELGELARRHGLTVIEDATESLGATYQGRMTGTFGHLGCFSFNGNKVLTTGGGGMIVTDDDELGGRIKHLVNQARDPQKGFWHTGLGWNYRMTNLEAALGLAQLQRLPGFLEKKRDFVGAYREILDDLPQVRFQQAPEGSLPSWWLPSVTLEGTASVSSAQEALRERGVPTRRVFQPLPALPQFAPFAKGTYPVAEHLFARGLNLPGSTCNDDGMIRFAAEALRRVLSEGDQ
ncbi:DegT/DnrJ/EryC1/StrS aminotransferase [Aminomonas paucivorans DSM 12260]|uniref:DegT/DnrJ/EryC1/StrS aminotransferase n=1 Tax=Aminomonas paucivorans DSM 12260 TaxID=584708 RepID=E3CVX7_9BACT|nr:aminotransferase class I/II-fold pyridoxal phosphate-dependent enzyme [Aminomonas paucivorans]EFQ24232.1 DegT/DnrJ/EryC1/StrS aminotransferase [Aminomonas paucivorans DSM 12260]